ncbi:MAG: hypothetical protein JXP37_10740, partial [Coriobacteriia bacterium]|nr:hypothetical protein [Coriobacteriia bacterium]
VWQADKLGGKAAAAVLTALAVAGVGALLAPHVPILGPWLRRRGRAIWLLAAAEAAGIGALVYLRPAGFAESARNMVTNLFVTGRNGSLWYVAVGVLVLSVVWGGHWAGGRRPAHLLVAIAQFFAIAFVVHGMGHPGRLSVADSFNRLSFHVVPLIYWYAATVLASVLAAYRSQHGEGIS